MAQQYIATRDFKDAGTEREFKAGKPIEDVRAGDLGNYEAAGLARVKNETDAIVEDITGQPTAPAIPPRPRKAKNASAKAHITASKSTDTTVN